MKCRKHLVSALLHADDTVILAEDEQLMRGGLEVQMEWCDEWSVEVNVEKSGIMHMRRKGRKGMKRTVGRFYVGGKKIRVVQVPGKCRADLHIQPPPQTTTQCKLPECSICTSGWMQTPPVQVAEGDTTLCKWTICSSVCIKRTTIASYNW